MGLVWSAPRIEGLSLRPNYAAAASGGATDATLDFTFDRTGFDQRYVQSVALGVGTVMTSAWIDQLFSDANAKFSGAGQLLTIAIGASLVDYSIQTFNADPAGTWDTTNAGSVAVSVSRKMRDVTAIGSKMRIVLHCT